MGTKRSFFASLLVVIFLLLLIPISWIIEGFVVKTLWSWHIASIAGFTISTAHGIGISAFISCMTHQWMVKPDKLSSKQQVDMFLFLILMPLCSLLIGYLALLMR